MLMIPRFAVIIALAAPVLAAPALAQVRFEVASIHPSQPGLGPRDSRILFSGDSFDAEAATVGDLLDMLNNWQLDRVVGGPEWMRTDRYDIHAKADGPFPSKEASGFASKEQHDALLALLADRFKLSVHSETRDLPAMVLLAPKMPAGLKPAAAGESYRFPYGANNQFIFTAEPMSGFTNLLSQVWNSPVVDQTGLEGSFDFTLNLSSTDAGESLGDRIREAVTAAGFKVEYRKVPTEVTVVDHLERPSEN